MNMPNCVWGSAATKQSVSASSSQSSSSRFGKESQSSSPVAASTAGQCVWDEETLLEMDEVVESVDQQNRQRAICASYDEDECMAAEQGLKAALCIWTVTRHAEVEWIECNEYDDRD